MSKLEKTIFLFVSLILFITSGIFFIFKNFYQIKTQFGIRPHTYTSSLLHLHILLVPVFVLCAGYLLKCHVIPKLSGDKKIRRKSGLFVLVSLGLMVLSGYVLQVGMSLSFNKATAWTHVIISFIWFLALIWHCRLFSAKSKRP
jgi:hypothetical protein